MFNVPVSSRVPEEVAGILAVGVADLVALGDTLTVAEGVAVNDGKLPVLSAAKTVKVLITF